MAKGQKRSGREAKKPKAEKKPAPPAGSGYTKSMAPKTAPPKGK